METNTACHGNIRHRDAMASWNNGACEWKPRNANHHVSRDLYEARGWTATHSAYPVDPLGWTLFGVSCLR